MVLWILRSRSRAYPVSPIGPAHLVDAGAQMGDADMLNRDQDELSQAVDKLLDRVSRRIENSFRQGSKIVCPKIVKIQAKLGNKSICQIVSVAAVID